MTDWFLIRTATRLLYGRRRRKNKRDSRRSKMFNYFGFPAMQLRSMQYRLPSASGSNDPKCVPHVESTSPVVVSTVTLVLFTLKERKEARSTKHEARQKCHVCNHYIRTSAQEWNVFQIAITATVGHVALLDSKIGRRGWSWQKGNAHNTMCVHVCMSSEFRLKVSLLLWQCLQPPISMAVQLLMNMPAKGR